MSAHQKSHSSNSNATPLPMGYVNREDARNLQAGIADCMLLMREHTGRFERPVYSRPETENAGDIGFGAAVPTASERAGRIYVAGPMSGIADFNFPVFNTAAAMLRGLGWTVENPAEHALADNLEWADYMAYDLTRLGLCGAIYLLPGWSKSKGAKIEKGIAVALGMDIQFDPNAEPADESVSLALPELNSDLREILGRPNFTCHFIAKALRLMGFDIPQKSEEEQAATIYWMLGHYLRDPINWRDAASAELKANAPRPEAV